MILVDPHVHVYDCYDREALFRAAAANFAHAEAKLQLSDAQRCLILTEVATDQVFRELASAAPVSIGEWSVARASDDLALLVSSPKHGDIWLFPGRQIATRERLEVAALLTAAAIPDGDTVTATVRRVVGAGGVPLLPLGVGKWTGARGRVIDEAIASDFDAPLFVGDNGGRLAGTPVPRRLHDAAARGRWNLPGSDPLPFPRQERRVGRCGFVLDVTLDPQRPSDTLRQAIGTLRAQPRTFFRGEPLHRFIRAQLAMQLRKRAAA